MVEFGIKTRGIVLGLAAGVLWAGTALATVVIDVNQPAVNANMAAFIQDDLAQSFKPGAANVAGAGIQLNGLQSNPIGSTITISLYDALPNAGGSLLGSGMSVVSSLGFVDVFFAPVSVTPGDTLFLVFDSDTNLGGIDGSTANPYPDGQVYANAGFQPFPVFDYTFRTYSDGDMMPIPLPAALPLMAAALGGLGWLRRRT